MNLKMQKRMAADIMKVGYHRVWFDEQSLEEISEAVTRDDMRKLINSGAVASKEARGTSRARANKLQIQKKKGRRRGHGSRKGAKGARLPSKRIWIKTIRPIRKRLRELRAQKAIEPSVYRKTYRMAKGGMFRSKSYLESYLKDHKMMR